MTDAAAAGGQMSLVARRRYGIGRLRPNARRRPWQLPHNINVGSR